MSYIFNSIFPVLFSVTCGYLIGKSMPDKLPVLAIKIIEPLVLLLLLLLGVEFGQAFKSPEVVAYVIYTAAVFAVSTTLGTCLFIYAFYKLSKPEKVNTVSCKKIIISTAIKECVIALLIVFTGILLSLFILEESCIFDYFNLVNILIYAFIFFVGMNVASVKITSALCCSSAVFIPMLAVVGSLTGGLIASILVSEHLMTSLALSSGFGWFSLSGILVSSRIGATYGAIALMTDLFRVLLAIILVYFFGHTFTKECVGATGSMSGNSIRLIIKQICTKKTLPIAVVSGLLLTLLTPLLITFFLANGH